MGKRKYSFGASKHGRDISQKGEDTLSRKFTSMEICLVIFSLVAYLSDSLTDILVTIQYFRQHHWMWASLTVAFIIVPSIIIQIFSARWYAADGKLKGCRIWAVHIFQLQPFERYLGAIVAGIKAKRSGDEEAQDDYYFKQNDVCMLRLFEAFLESAPQLTLQLYIMLCTHEAHWLTATSACVSLFALGWAVAAYSHALRRAYRECYSAYWPGLALQTLWHISLAAARVIALVAFASVYKGWLFVVIGIHWTLMTIWVVLQNTDFCPTRVEGCFFDAVVGFIYCFCFFNLKEGQTRYRMAAYYTLMFLENLLLVGLWFPYRRLHAWYNYALLVLVIGCFTLGIMCMLLYYRFCHPSGPIYCCPPDDYPAYEGKGYNEEQGDVEKFTYFDTRNFESPQRMGPKIFSAASMKTSKSSLAPRYTSTGQLPRRALLKQITQTNVEFKEVATPSQLSPIKKFYDCENNEPQVYTDCTLELDESLQFQHYTVDASACFQQSSKCNTLTYSGVDMSRGGRMNSVATPGNVTGDEVWKRRSREIRTDKMRRIMQSTPLYAQHQRCRIRRQQFSGQAGSGKKLGRLTFPNAEPDNDDGVGLDVDVQPLKDVRYSAGVPQENDSLMSDNNDNCEELRKATGDSGHGTDSSSTSSKNCISGDQNVRNSINYSTNYVDKETVFIRDVCTM